MSLWVRARRVVDGLRAAAARSALARIRPFYAAGLAGLLATGSAYAAGYDVPILYTARHQGMGGTAIAFVDDPSAALHNPAGLQGVRGLSFLGNGTVLLAHFTGSPAAPASASGIQSDLAIAPYFMGAVAYRAAPWLSLGAAVFSSASGGADYRYPVPDSLVYQQSRFALLAYELTPLLSLNVPKDAVLPGELSVGVGYRVTLVSLARQEGELDGARSLDVDMRATDGMGFRAGLQYRASPLFSIGVVYRNRIEATTHADDATVLGLPATDAELPFVLPAQVGGGLRSDYNRVGVAFDAVYTLQSQNERGDLSSVLGGMPVVIPNPFEWRDAFTLRFGFEFRLGPAEELPIRFGYMYDERVTSRAFPSPFAAPPSPTRTFTLGGGYVVDSWELNVALAIASASTEVRVTDLAPPGACPGCGFAGDYGGGATGLYLDFSTDIEL
jgi:long-chain fatty acid transport protein